MLEHFQFQFLVQLAIKFFFCFPFAHVNGDVLWTMMGFCFHFILYDLNQHCVAKCLSCSGISIYFKRSILAVNMKFYFSVIECFTREFWFIANYFRFVLLQATKPT